MLTGATHGARTNLKLHAFSVRTILLVTDPWALPTAIQFHTFGVAQNYRKIRPFCRCRGCGTLQQKISIDAPRNRALVSNRLP